MYVCMIVCMYVCMYVSYVSYVCMYVCMYVWLYVCMYIVCISTLGCFTAETAGDVVHQAAKCVLKWCCWALVWCGKRVIVLLLVI